MKTPQNKKLERTTLRQNQKLERTKKTQTVRLSYSADATVADELQAILPYTVRRLERELLNKKPL